MVTQITTEVLIVGGGTGGVAAAIQAARHGVQTTLVSEFTWLGGMLTAAGVSAPDGNELAAWQTGMWGAFLRAIRQRQGEGLDWGWVSLFTFDPRLGAKILAEWVQELPNLQWIAQQTPQEVLQKGNRITGVRFNDYLIEAQIIIDGTELGDILALGEVPHRWGWELQEEFNEPSAPTQTNDLMQRYPVQSPTWVFILQDYGTEIAPEIPVPPVNSTELFTGAWEGYGIESFLNYGRLPGDRFMINWPQKGNDYGEGVGRLVTSDLARREFLQEAFWYSHSFAHFLQTQLGRRYGLATEIFPHDVGLGAYALHPYFRESRRLQGQVTVTERDILPMTGGNVAALPTLPNGEVSAIAIGNYANDHHYPNVAYSLAPKSLRWGGRWTGTPFTIPYGSIVPQNIEGLLVCEKNISVSHIANGATRLQPLVMNIGQAAGTAAALCIQNNCQPQELSVRKLQDALLKDNLAPAAVIPLFNLPPQHPNWQHWQRYYLESPQDYPLQGNCPATPFLPTPTGKEYTGILQRQNEQYHFTLTHPVEQAGQTWLLITIHAAIHEQLQACEEERLTIRGKYNPSGQWLLVEEIQKQ